MSRRCWRRICGSCADSLGDCSFRFRFVDVGGPERRDSDALRHVCGESHLDSGLKKWSDMAPSGQAWDEPQPNSCRDAAARRSTVPYPWATAVVCALSRRTRALCVSPGVWRSTSNFPHWSSVRAAKNFAPPAHRIQQIERSGHSPRRTSEDCGKTTEVVAHRAFGRRGVETQLVCKRGKSVRQSGR